MTETINNVEKQLTNSGRLDLIDNEGDISEITLKVIKGFMLPFKPQTIIPIHPLKTKAPISNIGVCLYRMGASENLIMSVTNDYSKALECKNCDGGYKDSTCYTPFNLPESNFQNQYPALADN